MIRLRRIDHVCLRVADLARGGARAGRSSSGSPSGERDDGRALPRLRLRAVLLELVETANPGHDHTGFELAPGLHARRRRGATSTRGGVACDERERLPAPRRPRRARHPAHALPRAGDRRRSLARSIARPSTTAARVRPAQARPRELPDRPPSTSGAAFYTDVLGMRVTDWLGDGGVWFHVNTDHHVMALVDKGYAALPPPRLRDRRLGKLRDCFDHLAQHGRWLGWGPAAARHRPEHLRLRAHRRGGVLRRALLRHGAAPGRPRAARLARRPLLVQHLGAAAAALVLPLRRGGRRVRAREPRDARHPPRHRSHQRKETHGDHRDPTTRARTGKQFLDGLAATRARSGSTARRSRTRSSIPASRPRRESIARVFDLQHEHADEMLVPVARRRRARQRHAPHPALARGPRAPPARVRARPPRSTAGMMGRTPDYLNVTFACFAGAPTCGRGAATSRARRTSSPTRGDARPRSLDDALDHEPAGRPLEARGRAGCGRGRPPQGRRDRRGHRRPRRPHARHARAVRRRADRLPRLGHPPAGRQLRARLRDPDGHARA